MHLRLQSSLGQDLIAARQRSTRLRYVAVISSIASDAAVLPSRKQLHGLQNTDRPIAKPDADEVFAAVANHCAINDESAALPRIICRHAGHSAMARSTAAAPAALVVPSIFQYSGSIPRCYASRIVCASIARR